MPRKKADVEDALQNKGMEGPEPGHHKMYRMRIDGVLTVVTRISRGGGNEISDKNLRNMAAQCVLQQREFLRLVDCSLDKDGWVSLIKERAKDGKNPFIAG